MRCLMILLFIGLVGQAMGYTEFNLRRTEKLQLKDLLVALGDRLPEQSGTESERWTKDANYVAVLLARAAKKESEIFGTITIDTLLAMNEWTVDDCTKLQLKKRRKTCLQLCGQDEHNQMDQIIEMADPPLKGDELVPYNLGRYCWHIYKQVKAKCPNAQLRYAKFLFGGWLNIDSWRLSNFNFAVKNHIAELKIPVHELAANREANYRKAVEEVLAKWFKVESDRDSFKQLCQTVVEKLEEMPHTEKNLEIVGGDMRDYYNLCKVINGIGKANN